MYWYIRKISHKLNYKLFARHFWKKHLHTQKKKQQLAYKITNKLNLISDYKNKIVDRDPRIVLNLAVMSYVICMLTTKNTYKLHDFRFT